MKYTGKRTTKSHKGNAVVFGIEIGKEELALMIALVTSAKKYTPRYVETIATHGRLRNFGNVLSEIK